MSNLRALVLIPMCLLSLSCRSEEKVEPVVAQIGNYKLMVSDYLREVKRLSEAEREALKSSDAREAFMEQLIDQQVLIEEAHRLNIDKDKEFCLFVEAFWKQAMIERLIIHKTREVIKQLTISEEEVEFYFKEMQRKIHACIRVVGSKAIARKLLADEMLSYEEELQIQKDSGWHWFAYEEVQPVYRNFLFGMEEGDKKIIYNYDLGWVVLEVKGFKERQMGSEEDMHKRLMDVLQEERDLEILDKWIRQLRAKSKIHVNSDVLKQLEVE